VSFGQRVLECLLEQSYLRGVRAGLKDCDDSATWVSRARGLKRFAHRGRMMSKVIDHGNAADLSEHLQTPLNAFDFRKRLFDLTSIEHERLARRDHAQTVAHIEQTG